MSQTKKILVVDDSVVIRRLLRNVIESEPGYQVSVAANGKIALAMMGANRPDAVVLDIEMPEMDGLTTLREIRKCNASLPVVMFSTLTERGAAATIDALSAGASDYLGKTANVTRSQDALDRIRQQLIPKIKALTTRDIMRQPAREREAQLQIAVRPAVSASPHISAVVIGTSTGGPNALSKVIKSLPADFAVPVLVVQHMPPVFTSFLAARLSAESALVVREARDGEAITAGNVWIAPGDFHMYMRRDRNATKIALDQGPPENSCRPAVDVLFRSAAACFGNSVLAVVMTGMGQDGLLGCEAIRACGGRIVVQDEATSVVWGMPGYVARAGLADSILPIGEIGPEIARLLNAHPPLRIAAAR